MFNIEKIILSSFLTVIVFSATVRATVYGSDFITPRPERIIEVTNKKLNGLPVTQDETLGVSAPCLSTPVFSPNGVGYILIGDSRTIQMDVYCRINDTPDCYFAVAAAGQGYNYMVNNALPVANQIEAAHPEIPHWKYVICLGVNDLNNVDKYYDTLTALASVKDTTFVSVNPVLPTKSLRSSGYTNESIVAFNNIIRTVPGISYIDTYTPLLMNGCTFMEGLHYSTETTANVYNLIKAGL